jgi:predicted anti-sigma-YlaC factor YlaD
MLDCREVLRELESYLDDDAALVIRKDLEEHLGQCRHCRVVMDSTRHTLKIIIECKTFELPESLSDRIMNNVRAMSNPIVKPE